jgi:hypothetical protein
MRLSVSDNGPGIPEEADRQRATERFVRLEKSRSQPGSGLGLSLAKAVMKFHGGRLDLDPSIRDYQSMMISGREGRMMAAATAKAKSTAPAGWKFALSEPCSHWIPLRQKLNSRTSPKRRAKPSWQACRGAWRGQRRTKFLGAVFDLSISCAIAPSRSACRWIACSTRPPRSGCRDTRCRESACRHPRRHVRGRADGRAAPPQGEAHVLIALADLAGIFDAQTTVRRLSDLADACVAAASSSCCATRAARAS